MPERGILRLKSALRLERRRQQRQKEAQKRDHRDQRYAILSPDQCGRGFQYTQYSDCGLTLRLWQLRRRGNREVGQGGEVLRGQARLTLGNPRIYSVTPVNGFRLTSPRRPAARLVVRAPPLDHR